MINLFITDIDGCLLEPMKTPDWEVLAEIKLLNEQSDDNPMIPPLTICTGRPMPYAEAVAQWMGIERPLVFESAGIFHPRKYEIVVNSLFNEEAKQQVADLKKWLAKNIISSFEGMMPEFAKLMDVGLIHPQKKIIREALPQIREYIEANYQAFEVHVTDVSINIILKSNNKKAGIKRLCELQKVDAGEVAYIGDSSGDIPGLEYVGHPFAPENAIEEVKQCSTEIAQRSTRAVLEAYKRVIKENETQNT